MCIYVNLLYIIYLPAQTSTSAHVVNNYTIFVCTAYIYIYRIYRFIYLRVYTYVCVMPYIIPMNFNNVLQIL